MATLIDRAYLEIDGEVLDCASIDAKVGGTKKLVKAMNRKNRAIGHAAGNPEFSISAEMAMDADYETDFHKLQLKRTIFSTVIEYQDGHTETYTDCEIYDIDESAKEGSEATIKLEISALDMVRS